MNYSLLNRDIEHEVLPYMEHSGMTLLVWSPLHGGILTGKYTDYEKPQPGTRMGNRGAFSFLHSIQGWLSEWWIS